MWRYEKRLQYPVKISQPNPKLAQFIISQYGGPYIRRLYPPSSVPDTLSQPEDLPHYNNLRQSFQ